MLFCSVETITSATALNKSFSWEYGLVALIVGHLGALVFLINLVFVFTCVRERLIFVILILIFIIGLVVGLFPTFVAPATKDIKIALFILWFSAASFSISLFVFAIRKTSTTDPSMKN